MSRLTTESPDGGVALTFDLDITCQKSEILKLLKVFEKLKHYEDLEEQGMLLQLKAKVGQPVWTFVRPITKNREKCIESNCKYFDCCISGYFCSYDPRKPIPNCVEIAEMKFNDVRSIALDHDNFGKSIFTSYEEAKSFYETSTYKLEEEETK